jgi:hypothetical protein
MIKKFMEYVVGLSVPKEFDINGRKYTDKRLILVEPPKASSLGLTTLDGLLEYINNNIDSYEMNKLFIVVDSPTEVSLYSVLDENQNRERLLTVAAITPRINYGYKSQEEFCISLKSDFVQGSVTDHILKIIGNIEERAVKQSGDDGFSQSVTVKKDVVSKAVETVPSIVELAPYRTFAEIKQPNSEFILRLKEGPQIALFEADGGAWRNKAIKNIKEYLEANQSVIKVLA